MVKIKFDKVIEAHQLHLWTAVIQILLLICSCLSYMQRQYFFIAEPACLRANITLAQTPIMLPTLQCSVW